MNKRWKKLNFFQFILHSVDRRNFGNYTHLKTNKYSSDCHLTYCSNVFCNRDEPKWQPLHSLKQDNSVSSAKLKTHVHENRKIIKVASDGEILKWIIEIPARYAVLESYVSGEYFPEGLSKLSSFSNQWLGKKICKLS